MNSRLMLEVRRSLKPFLLFMTLVVLGAGSFAIIARNLTFERPWKKYNEVRVQVDDAKGVFPGGHQVRISGVKVGVISKSELIDGKAILTLKIEDKWGPIYKNAKMRIRPVTPLQDLYINVTDRGDKSAGVAGPKDVIPAESTITPVDISRVLNTFNGDTREHMRTLLTELGTGLQDGGVQLRASFAQLAPFLVVAKDATEVLNRRKRNVARLVHNFGTLSAALAQQDRALGQFVTGGNASLSALSTNNRQFASTLTELAALMPVMRSSFVSLRDLSGELDPALQSLKPVAAKLESGLEGLQQFGEEATPAFKSLTPAVRQLRPMARALSPTSASLYSAFTGLDAQAPAYDRLTKQTDTCMSAIDRFFVNTLSVFKFEDAYGAYPRAETTMETDAVSAGDGAITAPGYNTHPRPLCTDALGGVGTGH